MAFKSTRKSRRHRTPQSQEGPFFQPKLKVGAPNDKYEREADAVADKVVNGDQAPGIQTMPDSRMEEDRAVQEKHDDRARPQVQREVASPEEEPLQRQPEEEEPVQMMDEEEEQVQLQTEEEEEPVQTKPLTSAKPSDTLGTRLRGRAGKGRSLDEPVRRQMEAGFGRDFSGVNVHTDATADEMNQELGARAFARGQDVYFRSGEYNPSTTAGQRLLAHELTHTVQQGGGKAKPGVPGVQRNWDKATGAPTFKKGEVHVKVTLKFTGAVLNKSGKAGVNVAGLASAAKRQIEQSYRGKVKKKFMGFDVVYDVSTDAAVRSIGSLADFSLGKEHLIVVLDDSHPKVNGLYGKGPFYGSIVYLNEKHLAGMISGADKNTIPHEVGHTAGLKHLMEKREESSLLGQAIKRMHHLLHHDNMMWRGGGHPSYSMADADQKLTKSSPEQLEQVAQNITDGKLNKVRVLSFLDIMLLK